MGFYAVGREKFALANALAMVRIAKAVQTVEMVHSKHVQQQQAEIKQGSVHTALQRNGHALGAILCKAKKVKGGKKENESGEGNRTRFIYNSWLFHVMA
jgi:hypothetical protein